MSIVAAIRDMLAKGLSIDQALVAAEAFELQTDTRTARQMRNARYYERRKKETEMVYETSETSETSETVLIKTVAKALPSRAPVFCIGEEVDITPQMTTSSTPQGVKRGSRLPDSWAPSNAHQAEAEKLELTPEDLAKIADEFRNYWLSESGQRARKIDWSLTFLNRLRDQAPRYLKHRQLNGQDQRRNSVSAAAAKLADLGGSFTLGERPSLTRQPVREHNGRLLPSR